MLDDFLPDYDVNEVHSTVVAAPPATVMDGLHRVTPREVPPLVGFMALRSVPALLRRRPPSPPAGGSLLTTETRVAGTDEAAGRAFRRYWFLIRPGSGAIRVAWLRAIRRRAERAQPGSSPRSARP